MLSFECIKNEKSVYFLLTSAGHKKLDKTFDLSNFYICKFDVMILSILVDTFISKISFPMQPGPEIGSISDA